MNQPCRRQTAAGRFSGNLMTKVTVYFRTIRSGFNNIIINYYNKNIVKRLHIHFIMFANSIALCGKINKINVIIAIIT